MSFDKLEAIIKARTRGLWQSGRGNAVMAYTPHRQVVAVIHGKDDVYPANRDFFVAMGTLADLMLDVIKAADRLTDNLAEFNACTDGIFVERVDDALAALRATQEKLP